MPVHRFKRRKAVLFAPAWLSPSKPHGKCTARPQLQVRASPTRHSGHAMDSRRGGRVPAEAGPPGRERDAPVCPVAGGELQRAQELNCELLTSALLLDRGAFLAGGTAFYSNSHMVLVSAPCLAPRLNAGRPHAWERVHSVGAPRLARPSPVGLARRARGERHRLCAGKSPKDGPPEPPASASVGDDDDFFPGGDSVRAWQALEQETRSVIQLSAGFFLLPALLSWALRATVIDPLLFLLQVRACGPGCGCCWCGQFCH